MATKRDFVAMIKSETGMRCSWKSETQEYRVAFPNNEEGSAYYTEDERDAYLTAVHMAKSLGLAPKSPVSKSYRFSAMLAMCRECCEWYRKEYVGDSRRGNPQYRAMVPHTCTKE